jgi:uncharacterized membrane protein
METPASISKHPVHAMLVVFPIALWTFSLFCDFVALTTSVPEPWSIVALYTMAGGLAGALAAAVPGFIDYFYYRGGGDAVLRLARIHMVLNLTAVAVFAVSLWLRLENPETTELQVGLSATGVLLIFVSSWLGGHMVHVHGVGVIGRD